MHIYSRSFSHFSVEQTLVEAAKGSVRCSLSFVVAGLTGLGVFYSPAVAASITESSPGKISKNGASSNEQLLDWSEDRSSHMHVVASASVTAELQQVRSSDTRSGTRSSGAQQARVRRTRQRQTRSKQPKRIRFQPGTPPPDRGTPQAPYGTGSRGTCLQNADMPPLIHLSGSRGLDLTVSDHPSFWVYVPYTHTDVSMASFSLQKDNTEVYQQNVLLPTTPGIVEIAMPTAIPALEAGTPYRWYFEIGCPQIDPSEEPVPATVTGVVQRVASSEALESDLAIARSPLEEVEAYANNHIWHETLTGLAQMRQRDPANQNLADIWQGLLSDPSVGLENWADLPIVGEAIAIKPNPLDLP